MAIIFCFGSNPISWILRKQRCVPLSSSEAEYVASNEATYEAIWMKHIIFDMLQDDSKPNMILYENMSAIAMIKNLVFHARSKHIDLRHHFIENMINNNEILLEYIHTQD